MSEETTKLSTHRTRSLGVAFFIVGLFLIGGAVIFYLLDLQQKALDTTQFVLPPAQVNYPAPKLSLTALDEASVSLADYQGKVVLVNNWATWCPPCQTEMPELQSYYRKHINDGFVVVAIESGEDAATVAQFARTYELSFPIWLDPHGRAVDAFKNWDLPSSYVIDRDGNVKLSWTGPVNRATLEQFVTPLLEK
jgi:peroxiredoxin